MKLVCTIGSQGLSDGRRFSRGDVYEVDDEIASTLVEAGYAQVAETDVPTPPVKDPEVVKTSEKPKVVDAPEKSVKSEDSDDADKVSVPTPAKKKTVNKRR